jgi:hypothetical protein
MVVAMRAMCKMQVTVYQVVDMVSVRHGLMAAAGSVTMPGFMAATGMGRCAGCRIGRAHCEHMLIHMVVMRVMQVTVMQIILMVVMVDGTMTAIGSVSVRVSLVNVMGVHPHLLDKR